MHGSRQGRLFEDGARFGGSGGPHGGAPYGGASQGGAPHGGAPQGGWPPGDGGPPNPYAPPGGGWPYAPPPGNPEEYLASRGTRLGAYLVDTLLSLVSALPGVVLMFVLGSSGDTEGKEASEIFFASSVLPGTLVALAGVLALQIYQWVLISTSGQSLAKRWLRIRIVQLDGNLPGFGRGVGLRLWVMGLITNIPWIGGIVALVDALMIFGQDRRCLHDLIAGTRVVVA